MVAGSAMLSTSAKTFASIMGANNTINEVDFVVVSFAPVPDCVLYYPVHFSPEKNNPIIINPLQVYCFTNLSEKIYRPS